MAPPGDRSGGPYEPEHWPSLAPAGVPNAASLSDVIGRRLLEQRIVVLHGPLDETSAARVSAELMMLDAQGDESVTLRVDCGEAPLALALTLMDVVELMGVPVRALCLGQVGEGAVGVVAVCAHRTALPSTRFMLHEPATQFEAHVRNVAQWAELRTDERTHYCARLGAAAGRTTETVEDDVARGRFLDATEALEYGLLDEVARPDASLHRLPGSGSGPSPMGFRPLR